MVIKISPAKWTKMRIGGVSWMCATPDVLIWNHSHTLSSIESTGFLMQEIASVKRMAWRSE